MSKTTKAQKIINGLLTRGCTKVDSKSRKYQVFLDKKVGRYYFVGKSGALRVNMKNNSTTSIALPEWAKEKIIASVNS